MNNKNLKNLLLVILSSGLISYFTIGEGSFPYLGISFGLLILLAIVYTYKANKDLYFSVLGTGVFILSVFIVVRANPTLTFLNISGALFLGAIISLYNTKTFAPRILEALFSPILIFLESLMTKNSLYNIREINNKSSKALNEVIAGTGITIVVLMVILPLLAYANPFFEKLIDVDVFSSITIVRLVLFILLMIFIPKLTSRINTPKLDINISEYRESNLARLIPKIVTIIVLIVFFVTQLQLYTASQQELLDMSYSNAQQTREVFTQLALVAFVVLILIFIDKSKDKQHKISTFILLLQNTFLVVMALKSDLDYMNVWGYTHNRLYGLVFIIWVIGGIYITSSYYVKEKTETYFTKSFILLTMVLLIVVNLVNFDNLIYKNNQKQSTRSIDYAYLSRLTTDSHSYSNQISEITHQLEKLDVTSNEDYNNIINSAWNISYNIDKLKRDFESDGVSFRSFNLSKYIEYNQIKSISLQKFDKLIQDKQEEYNTIHFKESYYPERF